MCYVNKGLAARVLGFGAVSELHVQSHCRYKVSPQHQRLWYCQDPGGRCAIMTLRNSRRTVGAGRCHVGPSVTLSGTAAPYTIVVRAVCPSLDWLSLK